MALWDRMGLNKDPILEHIDETYEIIASEKSKNSPDHIKIEQLIKRIIELTYQYQKEKNV